MNARTNMQSTAQELWLLALKIILRVLAHARSANGGATAGVCTERIHLSKRGFLPAALGRAWCIPEKRSAATPHVLSGAFFSRSAMRAGPFACVLKRPRPSSVPARQSGRSMIQESPEEFLAPDGISSLSCAAVWHCCRALARWTSSITEPGEQAGHASRLCQQGVTRIDRRCSMQGTASHESLF